MINPLDWLLGLFSLDIGIDLGTANTLVHVKNRGIVINEPSVVAIDKSSRRRNQVKAIGNDAKEMVGRTPAHIVAIRPLQDGVISDFDVTEQMIHHFIGKVHGNRAFGAARPRVVIGIPSGVTEVENVPCATLPSVPELAKRAWSKNQWLRRSVPACLSPSQLAP